MKNTHFDARSIAVVIERSKFYTGVFSSIHTFLKGLQNFCEQKYIFEPPYCIYLLRVIGSSFEPSRPCWRRSHLRRAMRRAEGIDSVLIFKKRTEFFKDSIKKRNFLRDQRSE